jgi:hypothetical protein
MSGRSISPSYGSIRPTGRLDDRRYDYTSQADFRAVLEYDAAGLIVDYPGIAVRFA